jgi:hypothetical protein
MFDWIDPFEEFDRLKRVAQENYAEGIRYAQKKIDDDLKNKIFCKQLELSVRDLAETLTLEQIRPFMFKNYDHMVSRQERMMQQYLDSAYPLVSHIKENSAVTMQSHYDYQMGRERSYQIKVTVEKPFQYAVAVPVNEF